MFLRKGPQTSQNNLLLTSLFPSLSEMAGGLGGSGVQIDLEAINGSGRGPARCRVTDPLQIDSHAVPSQHTCHVGWRGMSEVRRKLHVR